jgi:1-acyl-sn-glycerol-3-phosphate acyltransferase
VVVAETRENDEERRTELRRQISGVTNDLLGTPPDDVVVAPPGAVLKTSSGKIRRAATREAYEAGRLGARSRALWWQVLRLFGSGVGPQLRRGARRALELSYAAWWWGVLVTVASVGWLLVVTLPSLRWRWAVFRSVARLHFWLTASSPEVRGREQVLPPRCIWVCNHASYVDALVVAAALPGPFAFAVKSELGEGFVTRVGLRRLGARFVERFDVQRGAQAARGELLEAVNAGERLLVFAEGTLTRRPGLAQFRLGAFVLACEAGVPVIPVVLRGTRSVLRDEQWLPHRAPIAVTIADPVAPDGAGWGAAVRLRDRVRATMLEISCEPDLAHEEHPLSVLRREREARV